MGSSLGDQLPVSGCCVESRPAEVIADTWAKDPGEVHTGSRWGQSQTFTEIPGLDSRSEATWQVLN